jgi:hypothetical protein
LDKEDIIDILRRAPGVVRRQLTDDGHLCYTSCSLQLMGTESVKVSGFLYKRQANAFLSAFEGRWTMRQLFLDKIKKVLTVKYLGKGAAIE